MHNSIIAWVNAHIGTPGNEAADLAARQGAENIDNKIQKIKTPLPGKTAKLEIDNAIRKEWKCKWQNAPHYKHTKHFYSGPENIKHLKVTLNPSNINHHRIQLPKLHTIQGKPHHKPSM